MGDSISYFVTEEPIKYIMKSKLLVEIPSFDKIVFGLFIYIVLVEHHASIRYLLSKLNSRPQRWGLIFLLLNLIPFQISKKHMFLDTHNRNSVFGILLEHAIQQILSTATNVVRNRSFL